MNKVIKQESELNLVEGARSIVRKFGPRKLAAVLALSSMLMMTACGKKEENVQNASITSEETNKEGKYRNRPLGGKIVDNHNKELYISKASDLENVIENSEKENTNSKESSSKAESSTTGATTNNSTIASTPSASTTTETNPVVNNPVVNNPVVEQPKPDLLDGETITYFDDGSYVVTPSQEYINPPQDETPKEPEKPSVGEPTLPPAEEPQEPEVPETPSEEEKSQGYVVRKLNYSDGVYFHKHVFTDDGYDVYLIPIEYANINDITTNIEALAEDDDAYNYALSQNWAGVGPYNFETYSFLDSVYNIEAVLDEREEEAKNTIEDADKGLYFVP